MLELIKKGDVRDALRSSVSELMDAPLYIVLSLDADDIDKWYARLEAGFVAGNILIFQMNYIGKIAIEELI